MEARQNYRDQALTPESMAISIAALELVESEVFSFFSDNFKLLLNPYPAVVINKVHFRIKLIFH